MAPADACHRFQHVSIRTGRTRARRSGIATPRLLWRFHTGPPSTLWLPGAHGEFPSLPHVDAFRGSTRSMRSPSCQHVLLTGNHYTLCAIFSPIPLLRRMCRRSVLSRQAKIRSRHRRSLSAGLRLCDGAWLPLGTKYARLPTLQVWRSIFAIMKPPYIHSRLLYLFQVILHKSL